MHRVHAAALCAAVVMSVSAAPASAAVYTYALTGTTGVNTVRFDTPAGTGADQERGAVSFSAILRLDTATLAAGSTGTTFDYQSDTAPFFTLSDVTLGGQSDPRFGGSFLSGLLRGAFDGAAEDGYLELQEDRLLREESGAPINTYEAATLRLTAFDGVRPAAGGSVPDFAAARNLEFSLSTTLSRSDADGNFIDGRYSFAAGTISATPLAAVPEPATWATLALGFGLLGAAARRRRVARA